MYSIIENLCLGTRRLDLFGTRPRRGWVTAGLRDSLVYSSEENAPSNSRSVVKDLERLLDEDGEDKAGTKCWEDYDPSTFKSLTLVDGKHVIPCNPGMTFTLDPCSYLDQCLRPY